MMGDFNDIADRTLLLMRSTDGNITEEQYDSLREQLLEMLNDPVPDPNEDEVFATAGKIACIARRGYDNFLRRGASNMMYSEASRYLDGKKLQRERDVLFSRGEENSSVQGLIACIVYHASSRVRFDVLTSIRDPYGGGIL